MTPAQSASRSADILAAEIHRHSFGKATREEVEAALLQLNVAMREWRKSA